MKNYEKLIADLKAQTSDLKELYLKQTNEWAIKKFAAITKSLTLSAECWYNKFEIPTKICKVSNGYILSDWQLKAYTEEEIKLLKDSVQPDYSNGIRVSGLVKKMQNAKYQAQKTVELGEDYFINKLLKLAEVHYEDSVAKLAYRIIQKGLNENNITLSSSRIDINFETRATDGVKSVRAFTILAWGEIKAPHYRYLVH